MTELALNSFSVRVYVEDTDLMGIVYHSNYLRYFERARTEMIRNKGSSLSQLVKDDCHFAINEVKLHYSKPAYLDDLLTIQSRIASRTSCSLVFEQNLYNQDKVLLCSALIKLVCINAAMKPRRLPDLLF